MTSYRTFFRHILVLLVSQPILLFASPVSRLGTDSSTTVVIVGTVHNATRYYDAQTLCRILDRVKPDLILVELDSSFFTQSMRLKPEAVNISMENKAVSVSVESRPVPIRPYDIEGRNQIYERQNYFKLQRELSSALNTAEQDGLLESKATFLLDALTRFDGIGAGFGSERPEVINSIACDVAMESKQYYAGEGMVEIVASVPSLARFLEFSRFRRDFWVRRNDTMVSNIVNWAKLFPAKTILVLCGYEHRYYLRNALKKRVESDAINLKEYWAY